MILGAATAPAQAAPPPAPDPAGEPNVFLNSGFSEGNLYMLSNFVEGPAK